MDYAFWWLTASLSAIALVRLLALGIWSVSHFRAFAIMLAVGLSRDITLAFIPYSSDAYGRVWGLTLPLLLLAHGFAAISTYCAIARLYPKIGRFAVWLLWASLVAASVTCVSTLFWEWQRSRGSVLHTMFLLFHWVDALAAGALIVASGFLGLFPRPLKVMPSNLLRHTGLLATYFAAYSLVFAAENLLPKQGPVSVAIWMERGLFGFVTILYLVWTFCLSRAGEYLEVWPEMPEDVVAFMRARQKFAKALVGQAAK
jgi:hypothetical protein